MTELTAREASRLRHIVDSIEHIQRYTSAGRPSLDHDVTYDAVLRRLTIIGEALSSLDGSTAAHFSVATPRQAKGQRNIIVHEYWRVDPEVIWATVTNDLPRLLAEASALLSARPR